jgi:hypothetical protein
LPPEEKNPVGTVCVFYPFAEERKGAVRIACEFAGFLAENGFAVLLFDYSGTGESSGEFSEISILQILKGCKCALKYCRDFAKCKNLPLYILGMRLGSTFALEALKGYQWNIKSAFLFSPVLDGAGWLKENIRRSKFRGGSGGVEVEHDGDKYIDIDGYLYNKNFYDELSGLNVSSVDKAVSDKINIIQIGPSLTLTQKTGKMAERLSAKAYAVSSVPFWLENDKPDLEIYFSLLKRLLNNEK